MTANRLATEEFVDDATAAIDATDVGADPAGTAAAAVAALASITQPVDSDLTAIAALATTSYGRAFLALADAAAGRTALGLGTAAVAATGAFDASGAAAAAQSASQPLDSDLTAIAALTTTSYGRAFLALADAAAARSALSLGTAATHATGDYDASGAAAAAQAASQPLDSDLTAIAALTTTSYGRAFLALADAAAAISALGLDADISTLALPASTTISTFGASLIDDAAASNARTTLGLGTAAVSASTDFQPIDSDLTAIAALTTTSFGRSVLAAADAAALRTLAGSVIGTDVEAHDADLTTIAGLSASNDDFIQRKSGAWANRTLAQVRADLATVRSDVFANRGGASTWANTFFFATDDPVASTGTMYWSDGSTWALVSTAKGELGRAVVTSAGGNTSGTGFTDLTGGSITFTLATARAVAIKASIVLANTAADYITASIRDGSSTSLLNANLAPAAVTSGAAIRITLELPLDLTAGSYTYKLSYAAPVSGTVNSPANSTTSRAFIQAVLL